MRTKQFIALGIMTGFFYAAHAQNVGESLLFSQNEQGSTARFKAMGNAQTALGGDISNISGNPAGLGFFTSSDVSLSLDYFGDKNQATYFGQSNTNTKNRFGLNQLGIVFNLPSMRARGSNLETGWLNFNVGIAYTKTNSFHSTLGYAGVNTTSTAADFFADQGYEGSFLGKIGYDFGLYDELANENYPMTSIDNEQGIMNRYSGYQSETNLSFGANYSNKFYLGAGIGLATINYDSYTGFYEDGRMVDQAYLETLPDWQNSRFGPNGDTGYQELLGSDYSYDQEIWMRTRGTGVNFKLGMIYKPVEQVRIGINATSPTWYRMSDDFDDSYMIRNYHPNESEPFSSADDQSQGNYYEYNYRTPFRFNGGIAGVFSRGLISADVEYIDYGSARFSGTYSYDKELMNEDIKANYKGAVNLKIGGELAVIPQVMMIRAGYNHQGNPYDNADFKARSITGGLGFRFMNYYIDATYQNWQQEYTHMPYQFTPAHQEATGLTNPTASVKNTRNNVFLTIGAKF